MERELRTVKTEPWVVRELLNPPNRVIPLPERSITRPQLRTFHPETQNPKWVLGFGFVNTYSMHLLHQKTMPRNGMFESFFFTWSVRSVRSWVGETTSLAAPWSLGAGYPTYLYFGKLS